MSKCDKCKYPHDIRKWPCEDCLQGDRFEPKPTTNADRIRAMTDEEIEDWYWWMHEKMMYYTDSRAFVHNWLRQEVDDEGLRKL